MANKPFDTTIIRPLERPLSSDLDSAQSQILRTQREYLDRAYAYRDSSIVPAAIRNTGVIGDSFRPVVGANPLSVYLTPGQGYKDNAGGTATDIGGVIGLNDLSPFAPLLLSSLQEIPIATPPGAGFGRIDLIQVRVDRYETDATTRYLLNPSTQVFAPTAIAKTLSFDLFNRNGQINAPAASTTGIGYKVGQQFAYTNTDSFLNFLNRPAVDSGYVAVAYVNVQPGATSIFASDIVDARPLLALDGLLRVAAQIEFVAGMPIPLPNPPVIAAPAGVRMAIDIAAGAAQIADFYLFPGDTSIYLPVAEQSQLGLAAGDAAGVTFDDVVMPTQLVTGIVDTALRTQLSGAVLPFGAAIGTPYIRYRYRFGVRTYSMAPITQILADSFGATAMDANIVQSWTTVTSPGQATAVSGTDFVMSPPITLTGGAITASVDDTTLGVLPGAQRRFSAQFTLQRI